MIRVIYLDLLEGQVQPVRQQYTRLSETQYHYQNVPNDFEAVITVDALGLVVDYPQLFTRTARQDMTVHQTTEDTDRDLNQPHFFRFA